MKARLKEFREELRPTLRLALPLVLAEIGWMSMGIVDTMMVGRLPNSAEAIGAVSLAGVVFIALAMFGGGLLLGLDTLVSQAFGAGDIRDCHRSLLSGLYLSAVAAPLLMGLTWGCVPFLRRAGIDPGVMRLAIPYLGALIWSMFPLLLYFALRRSLQAMNLVKPVTFALVSANLVNAVGNWMLVYGKLGAPAMGVVGSGWATCLARTYMAAVLLGYALYYDHAHMTGLRGMPLRPDFARIRRLVGVGLPAGVQIALEISVFAAATALIGRLGALPLAGHQIALNTVSLTFMVPLGISSAAAVRVGHALGRRDVPAASRAGWTAILLGAGFMACAAAALLLFPAQIARLYTPDVAVIRASVALLFVAAFFQLFDGIQIVATGALRGAGETHAPMYSHLLAYWLLGLPLGYWLCFRRGWGAPGLWAGLCLALILIGCALLLVWRHKVHALGRAMHRLAAG